MFFIIGMMVNSEEGVGWLTQVCQRNRRRTLMCGFHVKGINRVMIVLKMRMMLMAVMLILY